MKWPQPRQSYALRKELLESAYRIQAKHAAMQESDPSYWDTDQALVAADGARVDASGVGIPMMRFEPPKPDATDEGKREGLTLAGAIKAIPKVAAALVRTEDPALAEQRLTICKGCEHWDGKRCGKCGCFTALKVRLKSESCPVGKWSAVD